MQGSSSRSSKALWFQISGAIGTALFFVADLLIFAINPFGLFPLPLLHSLPSSKSKFIGFLEFADWKRATVSWLVSYALSIVWQHALHERLVFGSNPDVPYLSSLGKTHGSEPLLPASIYPSIPP